MHARVPVKKVLIPIDFSNAAREAFYAGVSLATKLDADTVVLHVAEPVRSFDFDKKRYVETAETIHRVEEGVRRRVNEIYDEGGLEAVDRRRVATVVQGAVKAADEILAVARQEDVDLIVIGSSGDGGFDSPLGTTAEKVMRRAHCAVLVIRARQTKKR